jgi:hypothetical protein
MEIVAMQACEFICICTVAGNEFMYLKALEIVFAKRSTLELSNSIYLRLIP